MNTTEKAIHALTAADVMNCNLVVVPQQTLMREAARLLDREPAGPAVVEDEHGHCVGLLSPVDIVRWAEAGCPEITVGPGLSCPYQVRGRLLTGDEAMICILARGSCPFQADHPTIGGACMEICMRPNAEQPPFGLMHHYMTTDVVTVHPQTPLPELERKLIDARVDHVVVLDEFDRPVGIVSATEVLQRAVQ